MNRTNLDEILQPNVVPLRGGCNTVLETQQIPMGGYSMVQNMRDTHPGKKKRKGQRVQHATADSTNTVISLYQFVKNRIPEKHFFAQMSDDDVLSASTAPPGVGGGTFGSESFVGSAGSIPASWSNIKDTLLFSNGVDQHQIYHGTLTYIDRIIHYNGTAAPDNVPTIGYDYSDEATDGLTTTAVILDSWDTYANFECVFIKTPVPSSSQTFTVSLPNGTASVLSGYYWNGAWTQVTSLSDGTEALTLDVAPATAWEVGDTITGATSGKTCIIVAKKTDLIYQISTRSGAFTLGEVLSNGTYTADQGAAHPTVTTFAYTGTVSWTLPTDAIPNYMYGECGYWMQFRVSVALDAEVEVTKVQFTSAWQDISNIWDSIPVPVIETQFFNVTADTYKTFGYTSIEIDSAIATDRIYFASSDPIAGVYVDVGTKPNTTAATTVNAMYYWNGIAWASVGTITDGTAGLSNSGWITFPRVTAHKQQFNKNQYYAYWYYFTVDKTLNNDVILSLYTQPYFSIADFGKGYCNTVWKERAIYGFDRDQYIYVSAKGNPQILNGDDYAILEAGDGRSNKPLAMHSFHNELMVWQEEKGKEGGCLTLFEGYSPETFGKLLLSTKIGTMNAKSVAVIDGVYTSTKTDEVIGKIAYSLSHYGVFMTDGRYVTAVSDDIQNYFDPLESECIRKGYENQMWLAHDTAYNVLRLGLVSGSSATTCNVFPVYDLVDKTWSFDVFEQKLSCMTEVEADSGNVNVIQMAGGTGDGFVYQSNYGDNDVTTLINSYIDIELNASGREMELRNVIVTAKTGTHLTITPIVDGVAKTAITETSIPAIRNKYSLNHRGMDSKLRIQNNTVSESIHLFGIGCRILSNEAR